MQAPTLGLLIILYDISHYSYCNAVHALRNIGFIQYIASLLSQPRSFFKIIFMIADKILHQHPLLLFYYPAVLAYKVIKCVTLIMSPRVRDVVFIRSWQGLKGRLEHQLQFLALNSSLALKNRYLFALLNV